MRGDTILITVVVIVIILGITLAAVSFQQGSFLRAQIAPQVDSEISDVQSIEDYISAEGDPTGAELIITGQACLDDLAKCADGCDSRPEAEYDTCVEDCQAGIEFCTTDPNLPGLQ